MPWAGTATCGRRPRPSRRAPIPRNSVRVRRHRSGRHPVGAVDVEPHAAIGADVRDRIDRVDRAGERGPGRGHDRDRRDAGRHVAVDRLGQRVRPQPARLVDRQVAEVVRADPQELDRPGDRVVDLRGAVDVAGRRPTSPSVARPGSACSRAAASAVTLLIVPPLVNAPIVAGNPTNSLTHRTAWCSICVAARASTARLMSYVCASRSAIAPISSPEDPMNAK